MKKIIFIITAVAALAIMSGVALALDFDLLAGQDMKIGIVRITNDSDSLLVEYILDGECGLGELSDTHLHVSTTKPTAAAHSEPDIPQNKKGNPKIGNFDWGGGMSFDIPFGDIGPGAITDGTKVYVAAHSGGQSWDDLENALPDTAFKMQVQGLGTNAYLEINITEDGILNGVHDAWCIDAFDPIHLDQYWTMASMDYAYYLAPAPAEALWLLNNYMYYIGDPSAQGDPYVLGDIQAAFWLLISGSMPQPEYDNAEPTARPWDLDHWGDWGDEPDDLNTTYDDDEYDDDVDRAQEIVADALLYGAGFEPECCEVAGVILLPYEDITRPDRLPPFQPLLIPIPAPCDETAWGDGTNFPFSGRGRSTWAMYIDYVIDY